MILNVKIKYIIKGFHGVVALFISQFFLSSYAQPETNNPMTSNPTLFSFNTDTQGWIGGKWQKNPGTTKWGCGSKLGPGGLYINSNDAWFTGSINPPLDLSKKKKITYVVNTSVVGAETALVVQYGEKWVWCQSKFQQTKPNTKQTYTVKLSDLNCKAIPDQNKTADAIHIWFSKGESCLYSVNIE